MPAKQRGSAVKRGTSWQARWRDEQGNQRGESGFTTKTAALDHAEAQVKEVLALRRGDLPALRRQNMPTLSELVTEYLAQHNAEANTIRTLTARLRYATEGPKLDGEGGWKDTRIDRIDPQAIGAWRKRLPERSAWAVTKALRQVLHYAVRVKLLDENVATLVPNPEPKRREVPTFETVAELEAIGAELGETYRPLAVFVGLTGLRPEEWLALEGRDIDRKAGVVRVRRVYVDGQVKLYGKQTRSLRTVPMPAKAAEALAAIPTAIGSTLLFPGANGGHLNLNEFRRDEWTPALRAAGVDHRGPYALRHTFASFSIAAGINLFELSRFMGTSVEVIDRTYGHLLPDSIDRAKAALDAFVVRSFPERSLADGGQE